jgi:hypothetical protein
MPEFGVKNLMTKNQAIMGRGAECRLYRFPTGIELSGKAQ